MTFPTAVNSQITDSARDDGNGQDATQASEEERARTEKEELAGEPRDAEA